MRRVIRCKDCGKRIPFGTGREHLRSKHPELRYHFIPDRRVNQCDTCGSILPGGFNHVVEHYKACHTEPELRPYVCKSCNQSFSEPALLAGHTRAAHMPGTYSKKVQLDDYGTKLSASVKLLVTENARLRKLLKTQDEMLGKLVEDVQSAIRENGGR